MTATLKLTPVRKKITVRASRARAFDVFTAGMTRWWPKSHTLVKSELKEVILEPFVGGRWFHRGIDGAECTNGSVLEWRPPERIVLGWQLNGRWEYDPNTVSEVEIRFRELGPNETEIELEHRNIERFGETAAALHSGVDSASGWSQLLQLYADSLAA
jgi:uncharacterized protein YndB with AHSA1/START domain